MLRKNLRKASQPKEKPKSLTANFKKDSFKVTEKKQENNKKNKNRPWLSARKYDSLFF